MIVPGGGFSLDKARWVTSRSNFLVHVNVLARLFRGKMQNIATAAHCSISSRPLTHKSSRISRRTPYVCCLARAHAAAPV